MKLGSHVSLKSPDFFLGSVNEALSYGANCLMVYTGAPQNTIRKNIDELKIDEVKNPLEVIIHAPYIVNLANPDKSKRDFSISFLTQELRRTNSFGSNIMVLHPGSHLDQGVDKGLQLVAEGLKKILDNTKDLDTCIAVETMAGKGSELCSKFEEIKKLLDLVNNPRVGVCFDTCHVNDAGYDLSDYKSVMDEFDRIVGKEKILVIHLNDSKNGINTHKDRHENIGFGTIGFNILCEVLHDEFFYNIPHILETPYISELPPYKYEIKMLKEKVFNSNLINDVKEGK